jgi:hypothetical protein
MRRSNVRGADSLARVRGSQEVLPGSKSGQIAFFIYSPGAGKTIIICVGVFDFRSTYQQGVYP